METTGTIASAISKSAVPTVLFLGAGSSISSGAPSASALAQALTDEFFPGDKPRILADIAGRVEIKFGRKKLIDFIRDNLDSISPSKSLLQLPNFNFANIFTTNYDQLIEKSFDNCRQALPTIKSNKDYTFDYRQYNTMLFKLHGCVTEDRADGLNYGMIITDEDYATYAQYRQIGFGSFEQSLRTSNVIFIGYSISDSNIKEYIEHAIHLSATQDCPGQIFLILYERDEIEALRWESRGLRVAFGDIDSFLASLATVEQDPVSINILSPVSKAPRYAIAAELCTIKPSEEKAKLGNLRKLVTGGEVTYGDVREGNAFGRSASREIVQQISDREGASIHVLIGASGAGKTSAARLAISELMDRGFVCYEHKSNIGVDLDTWRDIDAAHLREGQSAVLFLDEPNASQFAVNQLATHLMNKGDHALSLLVAYHPSIWSYRTKSAALVREAKLHDLRRLSPADVRSIATHVKRSPEINRLLATDVQALTHSEITRMVEERARADLFVSLKYLFETKSLDEIVLREFDRLGRDKPDNIRTDIQSIYSAVAFLEASGRHVHRQMVMRIVDTDVQEISSLLKYLDGVVFEVERDDYIEGVFQWKTRHIRIANIIAASKFSRRERASLFEKVILTINPSSRVERQFCAQLCNSDIGIESLPPKEQTHLYRLLSDALPGERVPRHRLIRNLIREKNLGEAEVALAEARDMGINDSVIHRYDVYLNVEKAETLEFLEQSDRLNLLETAVSKATNSLTRRPDDMYNYESLCRASLSLVLNGGPLQELEDAVERLRGGYKALGDDLMLNWIGKYDSELLRLRFKENSTE